MRASAEGEEMTETNLPTPEAPKAAPRLFLIEFATFAVIFWADWAGYIPLSKTPVLFAAAWLFMFARGSRGAPPACGRRRIGQRYCSGACSPAPPTGRRSSSAFNLYCLR
jgi:hypothetical protein